MGFAGGSAPPGGGSVFRGCSPRGCCAWGGLCPLGMLFPPWLLVAKPAPQNTGAVPQSAPKPCAHPFGGVGVPPGPARCSPPLQKSIQEGPHITNTPGGAGSWLVCGGQNCGARCGVPGGGHTATPIPCTSSWAKVQKEKERGAGWERGAASTRRHPAAPRGHPRAAGKGGGGSSNGETEARAGRAGRDRDIQGHPRAPKGTGTGGRVSLLSPQSPVAVTCPPGATPTGTVPRPVPTVPPRAPQPGAHNTPRASWWSCGQHAVPEGGLCQAGGSFLGSAFGVVSPFPTPTPPLPRAGSPPRSSWRAQGKREQKRRQRFPCAKATS